MFDQELEHERIVSEYQTKVQNLCQFENIMKSKKEEKINRIKSEMELKRRQKMNE